MAKLNRLEDAEKIGGFFAGMPPKSIAATPVIKPTKKKKGKAAQSKAKGELSFFQPPLFSGNENKVEKA